MLGEKLWDGGGWDIHHHANKIRSGSAAKNQGSAICASATSG
jgi:hypothetical protein